MVFDGVLGQHTAVETLQRALRSGRVHHAYRFEGPDGVGKERAAFALAQALVCTERPDVGCGACSGCRRAITLSPDEPQVPQHPDVVLVERGLYPAGVLGRTTPESAGIGVEQIRRVVLGRAAYPPYEASRLVFIFRAAHELTANAANALLKTLEEPRPGVHFLLITDQPRRLLDTVRSRTLPIRFGPLPDEVVAEILRSHERTPDADVIALASGSARRALALCEPEQVARRERFVAAVLAAIRAPDLGAALQLAATEHLERSELAQDLGSLAQHFALTARQEARSHTARTLRHANGYEEVQAALRALERHTPPALTLESLIARLRRQ
jgi:DNA polymerase III subunit delta'